MNRRKFLKRVSQSSAGFALGGFLTRAYGTANAVGPLAATALSQTDRILVIIRLDGGNDGLNTLVNFEDPAYYKARPTVNIKKEAALKLTDTQGLHPALTGFKELHDEGKMLALQGVGYPNPNRSHFRSTDIWMTASDTDEYLSHGWLGRYLESQTPGFPETLPEHPLAVDIGPVLSLSLLGQNGAMGIALNNPKQFVRLVEQGNQIIDDGKIPTPAGFELDFIRRVNFESLQYSKQVKGAAEVGANKIAYPDSSLSDQLALVARLVAGGLQSKIFLVSQRGYDTHANQLYRQNTLMTELNDAVTAFTQDLNALGLQDRVMGMTLSEFGRRIKENGSSGTDHGTTAPMFFFGPQLNAGIYGAAPDLDNPDSRGDFVYDVHFRQAYASVLNQWFGISDEALKLVFPANPNTLPLIRVTPSLDKVDFTGDGKLDFTDFISFAQSFGSNNPKFDLDGDGTVGFSDFLTFADAFRNR
ncbi:MAG: DUF1501 domain-containing protein [Candidatus Latescibacteria bacterium]|jgi:uncharacterized protein (DUF1501 family)|nr:DUF1501 domain-containing protein [Candidatus Latescibacterota bacterium]MBT5830418.1 DUF1501 domain-containing protein [Candidatus Latescibacterota bacterium]